MTPETKKQLDVEAEKIAYELISKMGTSSTERMYIAHKIRELTEIKERTI